VVYSVEREADGVEQVHSAARDLDRLMQFCFETPMSSWPAGSLLPVALFYFDALDGGETGKKAALNVIVDAEGLFCEEELREARAVVVLLEGIREYFSDRMGVEATSFLTGKAALVEEDGEEHIRGLVEPLSLQALCLK
ncbi:hypothetical protein PMAYCL1PPCAC_17028, partial [Pristionchus mayeri]